MFVYNMSQQLMYHYCIYFMYSNFYYQNNLTLGVMPVLDTNCNSDIQLLCTVIYLNIMIYFKNFIHPNKQKAQVGLATLAKQD